MLLLTTVADAVITAAGPLILKMVIDDGIAHHNTGVVVRLVLLLAGLAVVDAAMLYTQSWFSGRVGECLVFDLRVKTFDHVQRQPVAFFTRTQTGSLVSRLNTDVIGAQQAVTLLSQSVSISLILVLISGTMLYLSWQITVIILLIIPVFLFPARFIGH